MMGRRRRGDASHDRRPNAWSLVGLTLALIGPGAVALLSDQPAGTSFTLATSLPLLALFATLAAAVVAIAVVGESLRWRDVGFGHVSWSSLVSAVGLALILAHVATDLYGLVIAR